MSFGIYAVGYLILIAGVAYLAHLMHIPQHYIVAIAVLSPAQISSMTMQRLPPQL
jgi:hypothetical protein